VGSENEYITGAEVYSTLAARGIGTVQRQEWIRYIAISQGQDPLELLIVSLDDVDDEVVKKLLLSLPIPVHLTLMVLHPTPSRCLNEVPPCQFKLELKSLITATTGINPSPPPPSVILSYDRVEYGSSEEPVLR